MAMNWNIKPTNKSGVPDLPDDVYEFTVTEIKPAEGGDSKYDKGVPRGEFHYQLDRLGPDGENVTVRDWITIYGVPGPKTKLYNLIAALLFNGATIPDRADVNCQQLLRKRGRLIWGKKEKGDGKGVIGYLPIR